MMRRRGSGDGYQHLSNKFQFSIDVHLVPCLLSALSLKSLLFISSTKLHCHLLRKLIKTHSFAKKFCSDQSIGSFASVFIRQDQEPITCGVSNFNTCTRVTTFLLTISFSERFWGESRISFRSHKTSQQNLQTSISYIEWAKIAEWSFHFRGKKHSKMYLKINGSVKTPWQRQSLTVARSGLRTDRGTEWYQTTYLTSANSWFFQTSQCTELDRASKHAKRRLNWANYPYEGGSPRAAVVRLQSAIPVNVHCLLFQVEKNRYVTAFDVFCFLLGLKVVVRVFTP